LFAKHSSGTAFAPRFTTKEGRLHECWVYDADQAAVEFLR